MAEAFIDTDHIQDRLITLCQQRNLTLSLAESMTAGLATYYLSAVRGTCNVLQGSIVCYDSRVKTGILAIDPELIDRYTAESQEVTDALVRKLPERIPADIYAAVTGLADEGGSETPEKPVGTVFFSVLWKENVYRKSKFFKGSPADIKKQACLALYAFILNLLGS